MLNYISGVMEFNTTMYQRNITITTLVMLTIFISLKFKQVDLSNHTLHPSHDVTP